MSVRELEGPKRQSQRLVPLSGPPGVNVCGRSVGVLQVWGGGGVSFPGAASMPSPLASFFPIRVGHTGSLGGTFGSHLDACV